MYLEPGTRKMSAPPRPAPESTQHLQGDSPGTWLSWQLCDLMSWVRKLLQGQPWSCTQGSQCPLLVIIKSAWSTFSTSPEALQKNSLTVPTTAAQSLALASGDTSVTQARDLTLPFPCWLHTPALTPPGNMDPASCPSPPGCQIPAVAPDLTSEFQESPWGACPHEPLPSHLCWAEVCRATHLRVL